MERLPLETPLPTPPMNQLILTACNNRAYIQQQRSKACAALARAVERQKDLGNWEMETDGKLHGIGFEASSGSDLQHYLGLTSLTAYRVGVHLGKQLLGSSLSAKLVTERNTAAGWRLLFAHIMRV